MVKASVNEQKSASCASFCESSLACLLFLRLGHKYIENHNAVTYHSKTQQEALSFCDIFCQYVDKELIEPKTNLFHTKAKLAQKHLDKDLVERIQANCFRKYSVRNSQCEKLTTLIEPFCIISLSTFQTKEHNENLFQLGEMQEDVTLS